MFVIAENDLAGPITHSSASGDKWSDRLLNIV